MSSKPKRTRDDDSDRISVTKRPTSRPINPALAQKPPKSQDKEANRLAKKFKRNDAGQTQKPKSTSSSSISGRGNVRPVNASADPPPPSGRSTELSKLVASVKAKALAHEEEASGQLDDSARAEPEEEAVTFESLGVIPQICEACVQLGYKVPTKIQREAIPIALEGRDVIGLAQTGSGKTAAFGIPILQALWKDPKPFFACIIAPTRELALQISTAISALGSSLGVRCVALVGGMDMMDQSIALSRLPHVVVATPGRLVDHLENTRGFSLRNLRFFVMDEADRLLDLDFGAEIDKVLSASPRERVTFLFSATMTSKVEKLQRASLKDPVRVEVAAKYSTVPTLLQYYLFLPFSHKETYLAHVLNSHAGLSTIIFTATVNTCGRLTYALRNLGFPCVGLHGGMSQQKRLGALGKFKAGERGVLIATDVASRGLDISGVDMVINYDVPGTGKDYVHRVGRTARAGKGGMAVTFVTQYDIEWYQRIEAALQKKLPEFPSSKDEAMLLHERVQEALRFANMQMKEEAVSKGRHGKGEEDGKDVKGGGSAKGNGKFERRGNGMKSGMKRGGGGKRK